MSMTDLEAAVVARRNQPPDGRLEAVWLAYEAANGGSLRRPPSLEERAMVAEWLRLRRTNGAFDTFVAAKRRLRVLAHRTPAEKAGSLIQGGCDACELVADGTDGQPVLALQGPINVEPW